MASPEYSKSVLIGLQKRNMSPAEMARISGLTEGMIRKILREKASLSDRHLASFEHATGLSAGQLALLSIPNPDKSLVDLINAWAEVGSFKRPNGRKKIARPVAAKHRAHPASKIA
jgi:transcriptional regulator with XRE-family HTH domain